MGGLLGKQEGMALLHIRPHQGNETVQGDVVLRVRRRVSVAGLSGSLAAATQASGMLKGRDYVMFLPDIAYQQQEGGMIASIQAWVYEKQPRRGLTRVLAMLLGIDMSMLDEDERRLLYERTQLFRVDSERNKRLYIVDEVGVRHALPKTTANGRTSHIIPLLPSTVPVHDVRKLTFHLDGKGVPAQSNEAAVFFAPPEGISIISDIDDTIKQSFVWDTKHLLRNTFLEHYRAVDGMGDWYRALDEQGNIAFHYVSSSPIQLYPVLDHFMRRENFPEGSMHLREATRWTDLIPRAKGSRQHKITAIERLLRAYPQRRFILIGDSGEEDGAIYADIMRRYLDQILAICIRKIPVETEPPHYDKIFAELDKKNWIVSNDVAQMRHFIDKKLLTLHKG